MTPLWLLLLLWLAAAAARVAVDRVYLQTDGSRDARDPAEWRMCAKASVRVVKANGRSREHSYDDDDDYVDVPRELFRAGQSHSRI